MTKKRKWLRLNPPQPFSWGPPLQTCQGDRLNDRQYLRAIQYRLHFFLDLDDDIRPILYLLNDCSILCCSLRKPEIRPFRPRQKSCSKRMFFSLPHRCACQATLGARSASPVFSLLLEAG